VLLVPQLRSLRLQRAYSQEELAHRAGVARTTIVRAEAGQSIRYANVRRLARALGVSPARLQRPVSPDEPADER